MRLILSTRHLPLIIPAYLFMPELSFSLVGFELRVGLRSWPEDRGFWGEDGSLKALLSDELERAVDMM